MTCGIQCDVVAVLMTGEIVGQFQTRMDVRVREQVIPTTTRNGDVPGDFPFSAEPAC